ncbi:copper homeostasis protein cutC homolog [Ptychodera flava]|uniref:copper homeostasis protein cutC homolog n=1 Tax=Ptychodera flava TaxID=63121 RepID=UPI00396A089C
MEVCVDCVESAVAAHQGGASRIELCGNLMEGGTTPSLGLLRTVKATCPLPVYVMIRPRGGDFCYSDYELEVMRQDIQLAKENGADGIVFGILTRSGVIDVERCKEFVEMARPLEVTFHRAFDMVSNPSRALEDLIGLHIERVLTSGCDSTALEGAPVIKQLIQQAKERIIIVPGGGINDRNLKRILKETGAHEYHCSARKSQDSVMLYRNTSVHMGAALHPPEFTVKVTNVELVQKLKDIASSDS